MAARLNAEGFNDLVLVDDFSARPDKARNHEGRTCVQRVDRADFPAWLEANENQVQFVFHLGARTDTTEQDRALFDRLNLNYSQDIWRLCTRLGLPSSTHRARPHTAAESMDTAMPTRSWPS